MHKQPMIEVRSLYKNYGSLEVLRGVSLTVSRGEVVVIIGPSGSGKSTFLRCLNYLETPLAGDFPRGVQVDLSATSGRCGRKWAWSSKTLTFSLT